MNAAKGKDDVPPEILLEQVFFKLLQVESSSSSFHQICSMSPVLLHKRYILQAERDLRIAQSEFDRQTEITKLLLEGLSTSHAAHLRCLYEFVETQARFYSQCTTIMTDLQRELSR